MNSLPGVRAQRLFQLEASIGKTRDLIADHEARLSRMNSPYTSVSEASLSALRLSLANLIELRRVVLMGTDARNRG